MAREYRIGTRSFAAESRYLTLSLPASDPGEEASVLRARLERDGFLYLPGLHDREAVQRARREILDRMAALGRLDPAAPRMEGLPDPARGEPATSSVRGNADLKGERLREVVYGPPVMAFFQRLLGGPILSYRFQWLRTAGPGAASGIHCDAPYMGRGSSRLCTCWTPLGDLPPEMGPLALCLGSHRWERVRETYGRSDVDRDLTTGAFSEDPAELVERFGGRWATHSFRAGDAVVFTMHLLHASLTNETGRYRISVDTRYQPANEPVDNRWAGETPAGHTRFWDPAFPLEPVAASRRQWGV